MLIRDALTFYMHSLPEHVGNDRPSLASSAKLMCFTFGFEQLVKSIETCDNPYDIDPEPELLRLLHHIDARLTQYAAEPDQPHFDSLMDWYNQAITAFPGITDLKFTCLAYRRK